MIFSGCFSSFQAGFSRADCRGVEPGLGVDRFPTAEIDDGARRSAETVFNSYFALGCRGDRRTCVNWVQTRRTRPPRAESLICERESLPGTASDARRTRFHEVVMSIRSLSRE